MIKNIFKHYKVIYVVTITSILFTAFEVHAKEPLPTSESFSEGTKEFLSDPARSGSLIGTILAGAALANPLAPMLGGVIGFFIGKNTDYTGSGSSAAQRYANNHRSLIPEDGRQIASLTGLTGKQVQESEQTVILGLTQETGMENQSEETEQPVTPQLTRKTGMGNKLQQQLAYACSHVSLTQPLPVSCYYYSQ